MREMFPHKINEDYIDFLLKIRTIFTHNWFISLTPEINFFLKLSLNTPTSLSTPFYGTFNGIFRDSTSKIYAKKCNYQILAKKTVFLLATSEFLPDFKNFFTGFLRKRLAII